MNLRKNQDNLDTDRLPTQCFPTDHTHHPNSTLESFGKIYLADVISGSIFGTMASFWLCLLLL